MFDESKCWELCSISIKDPGDRFSDSGKILKSVWAIGPSKAVLSYGKVKFDSDVTNSETDSEQSQSNTEQSQSGENQDNTHENESLNYSYSILEAYFESKIFYERGVTQSQTTTTTNVNTNQSSDNTSADASEFSDTFSLGHTYTFSIGLEDEGFTKWVVAVDSRADDNKVVAALKSKNFKAAYQIASKDVTSDGLVPISATTYINKKPNIPPAFIGHCKYGFDSGLVDGPEEDLNISLAVAPIDARTKKPSDKTVIQAIYNVTGDITGGALGNAFAAAVKKLRDAADSNSSRYYDSSSDDKDSEQSKSEALSKYLHKMFKCVGDHTMYNSFIKIRNYIKQQIEAKNLELERVTIGNGDNSELDASSIKSAYKNAFVYF